MKNHIDEAFDRLEDEAADHIGKRGLKAIEPENDAEADAKGDHEEPDGDEAKLEKIVASLSDDEKAELLAMLKKEVPDGDA